MIFSQFINGLSVKDRSKLMQNFECLEVKRGSRITSAEGGSGCVLFVEMGLVRVVVDDGAARGTTTDFICSGEWHADFAISTEGKPCRPLLVAAVPSLIHRASDAILRALFASHPTLLLQMIEGALKRSDSIRNHLASLHSQKASVRVRYALEELSRCLSLIDVERHTKISQEVIASYTGLTREVVNRELNWGKPYEGSSGS